MIKKVKRKKRVLIIDDESDILEVITAHLKSASLEVVSCTNPEEAMKIVDEQKIDAVVTDYKMPQKNGLECINYIKKVKGPTFPVIVMTGTTEIDEQMVFKGGGNALLYKPIDFEVLRQKLREELECQLINPYDFRSIEIKSFVKLGDSEKRPISLVDFDEDLITVECASKLLQGGERYDFYVNCDNLGTEIKIDFTGEIKSVRSLDNSIDMVEVFFDGSNHHSYLLFRDVLRKRQEDILEFLKMTKGL